MSNGGLSRVSTGVDVREIVRQEAKYNQIIFVSGSGGMPAVRVAFYAESKIKLSSTQTP